MRDAQDAKVIDGVCEIQCAISCDALGSVAGEQDFPSMKGLSRVGPDLQ